jgi:hypothetical protein
MWTKKDAANAEIVEKFKKTCYFCYSGVEKKEEALR